MFIFLFDAEFALFIFFFFALRICCIPLSLYLCIHRSAAEKKAKFAFCRLIRSITSFWEGFWL